jgi:hypothetical protein
MIAASPRSNPMAGGPLTTKGVAVDGGSVAVGCGVAVDVGISAGVIVGVRVGTVSGVGVGAPHAASVNPIRAINRHREKRMRVSMNRNVYVIRDTKCVMGGAASSCYGLTPCADLL